MRICFFGDSFTNGTGDDACLGWVGRVCANERRRGHDVTSYNLGVRRDTSDDILRRWEIEARSRLPSGCDPRLVFAFANNDVAPGDDNAAARLSSATTLLNAEAILVPAGRWAPTLMIGPVPHEGSYDWNERVRSLSSDLASLCARIEIPFLDLTALPNSFWLVWRTEAVAGDGAHPNSRGYAELAACIDRWTSWRSWFDQK